MKWRATLAQPMSHVSSLMQREIRVFLVDAPSLVRATTMRRPNTTMEVVNSPRVKFTVAMCHGVQLQCRSNGQRWKLRL